MAEVSWSDQAKADLENIDSPLRDQLRRDAGEILHDISPGTDDPADAGAYGGIMWHRGVTHEQGRQINEGMFPEDADGPWNYFFFYRKGRRGQGFEVLAIRSIYQVASVWARMSREPA
jgi:hypothetical protein